MPKTGQPTFETLVAPHLETLFRMAWRLLRNTADAEDLVQDTCVAACGNLSALAAADSPIAWLLRVQHNQFIDQHRRRGRSPVVATGDADLAEVPGGLPDPEILLQQFQNEALLERAFLQLEATQRTLLALRAEGYELPEIASITGIDRNVLSARLHRARLRLAQLLTQTNREAEQIRLIGSRS